MRSELVTLLKSNAVTSIAFKMPGLTVDANTFKPVVTALENQTIGVVRATNFGAEDAAYVYDRNFFAFGFNSAASNTDRQALCVHEALHAACDIAQYTMTVKEAEASAYIAQCFYFMNAQPTYFSSGTRPSMPTTTHDTAWTAAVTAKTSGTLTANDLKPVFTALKNNPLYKTIVDQTQPLDGI